MDETPALNALVLDAMRLAECVHRTRPQGTHHRKAPEGEDRPASAFTKQDHPTQLNKFESLYNQVFDGHVPAKLGARYQAALVEFRSYGI